MQRPAFTVGTVCLLVALVSFAFAIFAPVGSFDWQELVAFGSTFFVAGHLT